MNPSVVSDSPYMEYFRNMAGAEEDLYRVWKQLTLAGRGTAPATGSGTTLSGKTILVLPCGCSIITREQYTHIYAAIRASGPLNSSGQGFQRVLDSQQGEFAFIHGGSSILTCLYISLQTRARCGTPCTTTAT